jgi:hypothetical protein
LDHWLIGQHADFDKEARWAEVNWSLDFTWTFKLRGVRPAAWLLLSSPFWHVLLVEARIAEHFLSISRSQISYLTPDWSSKTS